MLFQTTDDRIKNLEKRVGDVEKRINTALSDINDVVVTITEVVTKLQQENSSLKKEKAILESKQEKISKQIKETGIRKEIKSNVVRPVKNMVTENFALIQEVAKEGLMPQPGIGELERLVENEGEIKMWDAALKLKVHELQVEHWANMLKDKMTITEKKNRKYLCTIKAGKVFAK